ncbi:hypothetical protein E1189_02355 [Sansalvadorimonas verongulae]|nr:hypothetical protein [Sansalvadorimonas verongulae]
MPVHESKPGSAGNAVVKAGGAQSDLYAWNIENHVCWMYKAYVYWGRFSCEEEVPVGHGGLSHSVAGSTYSE